MHTQEVYFNHFLLTGGKGNDLIEMRGRFLEGPVEAGGVASMRGPGIEDI